MPTSIGKDRPSRGRQDASKSIVNNAVFPESMVQTGGARTAHRYFRSDQATGKATP